MEWINVKDKLPENNSRIFCCNKDGLYDSFFLENIFLYLMPCRCLQKKKPLVGHVFISSPYGIRNVTHWMPLPSLPE